MTRVLVAYATKHGSTGDIARAIGDAIREAGVQVDVRPARGITTLDGFDGVVVGSAVYMNKWQGDAIDFLRRFERELAARSTWLFSSGPTGGTPDADSKVQQILAAQPSAPGEVRGRAARIGIRGHATFGGRIVPEMGGFFERWMPRGDWRDFGRIREWATAVARTMPG